MLALLNPKYSSGAPEIMMSERKDQLDSSSRFSIQATLTLKLPLSYMNLYTGCPKKVETRFNFLAIEDKHAV